MKKRISAAALSVALLASLAAPASALEAADARALLEQYYVDPIPAAVLEAETVDEMLQALGDPYTVYYTAQEYEHFLTSIDGETLVGIGVSIQNAYIDGFELLFVFPDSPALEAGLQAGDKLIAVDGVALTAQDSPSNHITGEEGTSVTVTVRTPAGEVKDVTMVRRTVQVPIVTWEQLGSAGYIEATSFGNTTAEMVGRALNELDQDTAVWLMDLRGNPGGTVQAAAGAAGQFLGQGLMVYYRDGDDAIYKTSTTALCIDLTDKPLIILAGARTVSAAEMFTAAIRDHGAGISVGARTHGKGVAQKVFDREKYPELFDGDALKVTTYRFFSPNGATNHIIGVLPTLLVDAEHTETVARILSAPEPERSLNAIRLDLCGWSFYLDQDLCQEDPTALTALLEALPPAAALYKGTGSAYWTQITPAQAAAFFGVDYQPRVFSDLEGRPYQREINTLRAYDLVSGGDDGLFHPEQALTRAQLAVMLSAALDLPAPQAAPPFSDVSNRAWYADAVTSMAARGFMTGTGADTFSPDATLTRAELFTIFNSVATWCSMTVYELSKDELNAVEWAEFYEYPEWAQLAARNMDELGLDVPREDTSAVVTRGEAAGQFCTLLENLHILWNE